MHTSQTNTNISLNTISNVTQPFQEVSSDMQYEFHALTNDIFQPEHIFQLDQPIRPTDTAFSNESNKSPTTVLDLGSGTIQESSFKIEPHEQIWEFHTSPIKQEENSKSVEDIRENFPLNEETYNDEMCTLPTNEEFSNQYFKNSNIESSCRFQYVSHIHQTKGTSDNPENIQNYSHLNLDHACAENKLNSENVGYSGYSNDVVHYDEKFPETVYSHCDPFSDLDIPQMDYVTKSLYNNTNSLQSSGIVEDEVIFNEFSTNQNELNSHSCYSQSNFQSYMFLPQH